MPNKVNDEEFKARPIPEFAKNLEGQELIDYVNANQPFFKAGEPKMSYEQFKSRLMKTKLVDFDEEAQKVDEKAPEIFSKEVIPESFDAREKWPECKSIHTVRDQANCGNELLTLEHQFSLDVQNVLFIGSCWAVSSASAMSDRLCIATKGRKQDHVGLSLRHQLCLIGCVLPRKDGTRLSFPTLIFSPVAHIVEMGMFH
ncbi:unnamed protein product [Strongylus vulgaris]|uniref:Peptidase C1A papain C-terminal domain-containing protein n=1 Tax=Strongylus vulgaris TaxID=40348 RepID=A0A3P7LXG2_STRVU|nr:unnamed protein product [Strongylus vulgaris]